MRCCHPALVRTWTGSFPVVTASRRSLVMWMSATAPPRILEIASICHRSAEARASRQKKRVPAGTLYQAERPGSTRGIETRAEISAVVRGWVHSGFPEVKDRLPKRREQAGGFPERSRSGGGKRGESGEDQKEG
jgi:hypothetical protein